VSHDLKPVIRLCEGVCGRMTRNTRHLKKDFPDTVARDRDGKCRWCLDHEHEVGAVRADRAAPVEGLQPCKGVCGRLTRHSSIRVADAPESVTRVRDGKCQWCLNHEGEENPELPPKTGRPHRTGRNPRAASQTTVNEANVRQAAAEYEALVAARRERLARRERRERASIHQQLRAARGQLVTAGSRRA
jgi:hypothetical protein